MPFYEKIGTRVVLMTPAGGCYDHMTGIITGYRAGNLDPVEDPADSHFAAVRLDEPAANCGEIETIFPWNQVFPAGTAGNYWRPRYESRQTGRKGGNTGT